MVVKWELTAIQDLKEFKEFSKKVDTDGYISKLIKYGHSLSEQPNLGKVRFYINKIIVRQLIYEQHSIWYYEEDDIIHIISIINHRQDIRKKINFIKQYYSKL